MRSIILIFIAMIVATAQAATLYRWVDENGRVHYSDRPQQGADVVEVKPAQTYQAPRPPARPAPAPVPEAQQEPATGYGAVAIVRPTPDQVLWNIGTILDVALALEPALQPGHRIVVRFNGEPVTAWPAAATTGQVTDVYRGTHTISAEVVDAAGRVLATANPVTFYVKQTSILRNN